jgi:hypothetical protein
MNDSEMLSPFLLAVLALVVPNLRAREGLNWQHTSEGIQLWLDTDGPRTVSLTLSHEELTADPIPLGIEVAENLLARLREPLRYAVEPYGLVLRAQVDEPTEGPHPRIRPCRSSFATRLAGPVPGRMEPESAP